MIIAKILATTGITKRTNMEKNWLEKPEQGHNLLSLISEWNERGMYSNITKPKSWSGQPLDTPHWSDAINTKKRGSYWNYPKMWGEPLNKSKRFYTDTNYYDVPPHYGMPRSKKSEWPERLLRDDRVPEDINEYYINKNLPVPRNIPEQWLNDDASTRAYLSALEAKRTESPPATLKTWKNLLNLLK
jgi:hypothetical protein